MKIGLGSFVLVASLAWSGVAAADQTTNTADYTESKGTDGNAVTFKDDPLQAGGLDPNGVNLKLRGGPKRFLLIRPRLQFVTELLKSVENI